MPPVWTAAQAAAINIRGCDLLVSAAAGSGKTAALTERIIRAITREDNPLDITRILAVTFTRAAAAELRRRISQALSEHLLAEPGNTRLVGQLMLLGSAKICTIDAFYNEIVKTYFQRTNLPAGYRIADDAELTLLQKAVMESLINRSFAAGGTFPVLADNFTGNRDDRQLADFFIGLYENIRVFPEGVGFLSTYAEILKNEAGLGFFHTRAGRVLSDRLCEELECYLWIFNTALANFMDDAAWKAAYSEGYTADRDHILALLEAIRSCDYDTARETALSYSPKKLKTLRNKTPEIERFYSQRNKIKYRLMEIAARYFSRPGSTIPDTFKKTAEVCLGLYDFLSQYEKELREEKLSRGICDFEDIRRITLELLVDQNGQPTDIAREYACRFDEILIDEYQDVDRVQDMIFRALSTCCNRFMVGDIKQSIYSFRGAEPSLFSGYRARYKIWNAGRRYKPEPAGLSVFMSNNFRCDENIINFVNLVCLRIFPACASLGYVPEDNLIFSKKTPAGYRPPPVVVTLIHKGSAEDSGKDAGDSAPGASDNEAMLGQPELRYIAGEISRLLREEKNADGSPVKPGDIAVLCRKRDTCGRVAEALGALGIPATSDNESGYYTDPAVSLIISLLTVIDNPQKDIPLAAVLRSPLFGFTMDDLICIRRQAEESCSLYDALELASTQDGNLAGRCRRFVEKLSAYRVLSRSLPADELLRHILRDISAFSLAGGSEGQERLLRLYEYARRFEAGSFRGLYNFIHYVNNAIEAEAKLGEEAAEPSEDAVNVITIHHAKGLEFNICFVAGCGKEFNFSKIRGADFLPDPEVGPAVRLRDPTGLARVNNQLMRAAVLKQQRCDTEEEMRLLYVAMTRARERLYLTAWLGGRQKLENKLDDIEILRRYPGSFAVLSAKSYLDWLLLSLDREPPAGAPYEFKIITDNEVPQPVRPAPADSRTKKEQEDRTSRDPAELERLFDERFSFVYPHAHLTRLPAKLSVSRLYPGILDEGDNSYDLSEVSGAGKVTVSELLPTTKKPASPPAFAADKKAADSAERGTATHVFLQFCNFERCRAHGIDSELAYLIEKKFISKHLAYLVDKRQIEAFFNSDLYALLSRAKWIRREQRFNILLPASLFTERPGLAAELKDEELLIQGVVDLFFEDGDGRLILCDYKTDHLTPAELADPKLAAAKLGERYKPQLSYYASALSRICGRRPDRVVIYSTPLGGTVDVEVDIF